MDRASDSADEVQLTAEEYAGVRAAVAAGTGHEHNAVPATVFAGTGRWVHEPAGTLNGLFDAWLAVVSELEDGYSGCAPELGYDVRCRSTLARVWPLLPERVRRIRQQELDELDDRFRAATVPWPGRDPGEDQWWCWRVPRLLQAERDDRLDRGWPLGWDMSFPKPDEVEVTTWD